MLVLSRKVGERIVIADNIVLEVTEINHRTGRIMLGISAPRDVPIRRAEIADGQRPAAATEGGVRP